MIKLIEFQKIIFTKKHIQIFKNWAFKCQPNEAPAILVGRIEEESYKGIVSDVYPVPNEKKSQLSFQIDLEDYYRIYQLAKEKKKKIIGIFHSHPMDPIPSGVDMPFLKFNQNIWVILSTTQKVDNLKAYQWINNKLNKIEIIIID